MEATPIDPARGGDRATSASSTSATTAEVSADLQPTRPRHFSPRDPTSPPIVTLGEARTYGGPTRQRRASHAALACSWRLQLVRLTTAVTKGGGLAVAALFGRIRTDHDHRNTTRTRSKLECCVSSPETASTDAPAPQEPLGAGLKFEAAGSTSHHGRAPKDKALSPVRRHYKRHEPITASAAPRARKASSSAASPPQRQRAPTHLRRASHAALA